MYVIAPLLPLFAQWASIPVIIMTSDDEEDTSENMLSLGADDCLKKPLGEGLLKMRINKALESNRLKCWVAKVCVYISICV